MRRAICSLLLASLTPVTPILWGASAQYDPDAPEPIGKIGGQVVVLGRDASEATFTWFVGIAGGEDARLCVLGEDDLDRWKRFGAEDVVRRSLGSEDDGVDGTGGIREVLANATGVWLAGDDPARFASRIHGTGEAEELAAFLRRGGVVGAQVPLATVLGELALLRGEATAPGLGLLPGSIVGSRQRVLAQLQDGPDLVGFTVAPRAALLLRGRTLVAIGDGGAQARIAASEGRALRTEPIGEERHADLIALSRSAVARTLAPFPPAEPKPPSVPDGHLVMVGGGGVGPEILDRFVELAGGPDAPIVYVPCTSRDEVTREPGMVRELRRAGARNVTWIHTKDRGKANADPAILDPLREARGIWFGGGRQWNLVDSYQHTKAHELMHGVLARGGVLGGSSAGATIQGDYLARGDPLGNTNIIAEGYESGLGFLTGVAIDQHFTQRRRRPDMTELKSVYPQLLGIGLDEGTALHVHGTVGEVLGSGRVFFYDRDEPRPAGNRERAYTALAAGARYDLAARKVVEDAPKRPPGR